MKPNERTASMLELVAIERGRQRELLERDPDMQDCANPSTDDDVVLRVLAEEVGEVAAAIDLVKRSIRNADAEQCLLMCLEHLREELVQVAAVAVAGAERVTALMETVQTSIAAENDDSEETTAVSPTP
jgi:NTP pyrophosphatase (non-canonical NTP hydrolase)